MDILVITVIFFVCTFSGVLTGLLGLGGGLVIIPVFLFVLPFFGLNLSIHEIVGISAACVFINSAVTLFYRRKENFYSAVSFKGIALSIVFGTFLGSYLSSFAPRNVILLIFLIVSAISLFLMQKDFYFDLSKYKLKVLIFIVFALIGAISASIGIGGALLFATALKCTTGKNTKELLPTITLLVLVHAVCAFIGKFYTGVVSLNVLLIAFPASIIGSKMGVEISKRLSAKVLNNILVSIFLISIIKIIFELF